MRTTSALLVGVHDPAYANGASFGKVNTDIGRLAYVAQGFLRLMCLSSSAPHIFFPTAPASSVVMARRRCGSGAPILTRHDCLSSPRCLSSFPRCPLQ